MRIILLKQVKKLGNPGDIKEVSDGYAINFLFPQNLAQLASKKNINNLQDEQKKVIKDAESGLLIAEEKAEKLQGMSIEMKCKCNDDGKLYAAISSSQIVKKLKEKGVEIKTNQINLMEPIKEVGEHAVFVALDHNLEAEITIIITE
jgi:large subunit ribosomal protein L9